MPHILIDDHLQTCIPILLLCSTVIISILTLDCSVVLQTRLKVSIRKACSPSLATQQLTIALSCFSAEGSTVSVSYRKQRQL